MTIKLIPLKKNYSNKGWFESLNLNNFKSYYQIILILILIIICIFIYRLITAKNEVGTKKKLYRDIEEKIETGDLIFASYSNLFGYFMRGWTHSKWTHVGMILRSGNELYVMETADYSSSIHRDKLTKQSGIMVIPLNIWRLLHRNQQISYMKLHTPKDWNRGSLATEFLHLQEQALDSFSVGPSVWMNLLWRQRYKSSFQIKDRNITCFELVVQLLQATNVAQKIYTPSSYYTHQILNRELPLNPGFSFSTPVKVISDFDVLKS